MLQTIRTRTQGWVAWVIVALISIPFALWGIQSYFDVGSEPVAATINGIEISNRDLDRRVQETRIKLREQLGNSDKFATFEDQRLRTEVLENLIQELLLRDVTQQLGLRVSDQDVQLQILSEPAFQKDGRFHRETYERMLQLQGLTPVQFEAQVRQQMTGTQLIRAVAGSEFVTRAEFSQYQRLIQQQRELVYTQFHTADFAPATPPDDAASGAFYNTNTARFQTPEQVKLDYILLDASALATQTVISDDELRQHYTDNPARFIQPERRQISHLLLKVASDADDAAANEVLTKLNDIRARILAGEAFADLAKQFSADAGSAAQGGSLGDVEKGVMVPAFEQAAFALPVGEVSAPVRTQFGYHLIVVTAITPPVTKPFEEVREQLLAELRKQRSDAQFYELGERLANLAYESPDRLEPAAEALGLTVQKSDWLARTGGTGILSQPKVLAAAFSEEVLTEGRNSELIEPERDSLQAVVVRVAEHRAADVKPLAEVRDEIIAAINAEKSSAATEAAASAAAKQLREGADWAAVLGNAKLETPGLVTRQADKIPAEVLETAFTLPLPTDGAVSVGTARLAQGDVAVVRLLRVQDGEITANADLKTTPEAAMLAQVLARQMYAEMLKDMKRRADIERTAPRSEEHF
ncbi:SurA N-terminal domain-containing protein [Chromatium okenii]|uniref:SurA N-terminal domain-containing protein n=1 Tax=Chromatium okenii TaxID=61644 RepID=UPI0026EA7D23|nr:SurA N-terminal domain-containing protein [Chromatium okenii]MBV5309004.1 SurA N-terminal domain-containing protein [Chromatium okenii]